MKFESPVMVIEQPVSRLTLVCRASRWPAVTHGAILLSADGQDWQEQAACTWGEKGTMATLNVNFKEPLDVGTFVKGIAFSDEDFLAECELAWPF